MTARQWRRILLYSLLGVAQCVFLLSYVFVVRFVKVEGNTTVPSEAVISASSLQVGDFYWAYLLLGLPQRVSDMPQLKQASVSFCPGGIVVISVKERQPVALVATANEKIPWLCVDSEGIVLGPPSAQTSALPHIRTFHPVSLDSCVPNETMRKFDQLQPSCAKVFGKDLLCYNFDNLQAVSLDINLLGRTATVLIGNEEDFGRKSKLAYALLETVRRAGKPVQRIDLRFANPVVSLVNPPKPSPSPSPDGAPVSDTSASTGDETSADTPVEESYDSSSVDVPVEEAPYAPYDETQAEVYYGGDRAQNAYYDEPPAEPVPVEDALVEAAPVDDYPVDPAPVDDVPPSDALNY